MPKPSHEQEIRMEIYKELLKETGDIPSLDEIDQRYKEKYA
jgi:hypothetical protein